MAAVSTTESYLPRQCVTREQAIVVYRETLKIMREDAAAKGETFDKAEYDAGMQAEVDHQAGQAGMFPNWAVGRWAEYLLDDVHRTLSRKERKMSKHSEEWGAFLSGGHLFVDNRDAVAACERICKLAGLHFVSAEVQQYASGWSR